MLGLLVASMQDEASNQRWEWLRSLKRTIHGGEEIS